MVSAEIPFKSCKNIDFRSDHNSIEFTNHLNRYNEDEELINYKYVCDICSKRFIKSSHLNRHKLIHSKEKQFRCDYCVKCYSRNDHLQRHLTVHGINSKPYICPFEGCNLTFYDSSKLRKHFPTHNKIQDNYVILGYTVKIEKINNSFMFKCPISNCEMLTKSIHGMKRHIFSHSLKREKLLIKNQIISAKEEESFKKNDSLKQVYICGYDGCHCSYIKKSSVISHINVCHKNIKFTCNKCRSTYKWKRNLDKHKCKLQDLHSNPSSTL